MHPTLVRSQSRQPHGTHPRFHETALPQNLSNHDALRRFSGELQPQRTRIRIIHERDVNQLRRTQRRGHVRELSKSAGEGLTLEVVYRVVQEDFF